MSKKSYDFQTGTAVFYPAAGVGVIEDVEDVYMGGKVDACYVIRIEENQMTVKVPLGNIGVTGIRPLLPTKKIKELYKVLEAKSPRRVTGGNWTERCKELERRINHGSSLELGEVVRDLLRWKSDGGLSFEEAMLLEQANAYLARELATVQGITPELAASHIRDHVGVAA